MSDDWSIKPELPNFIFPWENYDPRSREEVEAFFNSPEIRVIKERMCDIGRRLWAREYVDGNGGNISVRVAKNLLLCSPTLISKGFMTPEDICMVDMEGRQKAGIRPSTSEVKTHIAMMKSVGVNACIHAHPPHCTGRGVLTPRATRKPLSLLTGATGLCFPLVKVGRFVSLSFQRARFVIFCCFSFSISLISTLIFFFLNSWKSQETIVPTIPGNSNHRERGGVRG